jgi:signal peptidase I
MRAVSATMRKSRATIEQAVFPLAVVLAVLGSGCVPGRDGVHAAFKDLRPDHHYSVYYSTNDSMLPAIHAHTDQLVVDESAYDSTDPARGDVIVFGPPPYPSELSIKRVIAIPGDKVAIHGGIVKVNGRHLPALHPDYEFAVAAYQLVSRGVALDVSESDVPPRSSWNAPDRLPRGCYFVLGDNVNEAVDSHQWGCIELRGRFSAGPHRGEPTLLVGKVVKIVSGLTTRP